MAGENHGSMTACIAAATKTGGGIYDGVAPDATLISCRVPDVDEAYLIPAFEQLIDYVQAGEIGRLVINNSFGPRGSRPAPVTAFIEVVKRAVAAGIVVVFSAGDTAPASVCPAPDSRSGINGVNSLAEVITVGTVDENDDMNQPIPFGFFTAHQNGCRGPGQFEREKPDCVAPTYGRVMWGCDDKCSVWWGTSGAAPQVAGLAALMLSKNDTLTPGQIKQIIKRNCVALPLSSTCAGAGRIDCQDTLRQVPQASPKA
jgi:subtilisin family serine protease